MSLPKRSDRLAIYTKLGVRSSLFNLNAAVLEPTADPLNISQRSLLWTSQFKEVGTYILIVTFHLDFFQQ